MAVSVMAFSSNLYYQCCQLQLSQIELKSAHQGLFWTRLPSLVHNVLNPPSTVARKEGCAYLAHMCLSIHDFDTMSKYFPFDFRSRSAG